MKQWRPDSFDDLIAFLALKHPWTVFRGQASAAWSLDSTLRRALLRQGRLSGDELEKQVWRLQLAEDRAISGFRRQSRQHLDHVPEPSDTVAWLTLMQHYGAPTRLLDWTWSPFIAIYFAYGEYGRDDDGPSLDRAIWMLDWKLCSTFHAVPSAHGGLHPGHSRSSPLVTAEHAAESLRQAVTAHTGVPYPIFPEYVDSRMLAQRGVLTACTSPLADIPGTAESAVASRGDRSQADRSVSMLRLIRLPADWRLRALAFCKSAGITGQTLFPGLDGIGRSVAEAISADAELRDEAQQGLSVGRSQPVLGSPKWEPRST